MAHDIPEKRVLCLGFPCLVFHPRLLIYCLSRDRFIAYSGSNQSLLLSFFYDALFTNVPDLGAYTRRAGKATERDDAICQLSHLSLVNLMLHND
jgi:hypothetical protein